MAHSSITKYYMGSNVKNRPLVEVHIEVRLPDALSNIYLRMECKVLRRSATNGRHWLEQAGGIFGNVCNVWFEIKNRQQIRCFPSCYEHLDRVSRRGSMKCSVVVMNSSLSACALVALLISTASVWIGTAFGQNLRPDFSRAGVRQAEVIRIRAKENAARENAITIANGKAGP